MTSADLATIGPRYQVLLAKRERELEQLRQLRHVVLRFLDRKASFGELRQAATASGEVQK